MLRTPPNTSAPVTPATSEWIPSGALAAYLQADQAQPGQIDTLCLIAKEYSLSMSDVASQAEKRKRGETALEYAKRAEAIDANNAHVQLSLAVCYGRLAPILDSRTKLAYSRLIKEHADHALRLEPANDLTLHVLGAWNYELANLNPILRAIATTLYGKIPPASNEEAARCLQKSIALNPARIANHVVLGKTFVAQGDKDHARAELQKALAIPDHEKDDDTLKQTAREVLKKL